MTDALEEINACVVLFPFITDGIKQRYLHGSDLWTHNALWNSAVLERPMLAEPRRLDVCGLKCLSVAHKE